MLQDAVARNLEILGEATRQLREVLPDADARFPEIPFRIIYATRNRLAHAYALVNRQIIWELAEQDIPVLRRAIEEVLTNWPADLT